MEVGLAAASLAMLTGQQPKASCMPLNYPSYKALLRPNKAKKAATSEEMLIFT